MVILVLLIATVLMAPSVYQYYHKEEPVSFKKFHIALAQLKKAGVTGNVTDERELISRPGVKQQLFTFDPNNLPVSQWQQLGLTPRQIQGIKNYEAKGGKFYNKADVKKIYTLTLQDYQRLEPYISLPSSNDAAAKPLIMVELNTADSATLIRLNGVGPAFARRIIQYRTRLGGFHNKQQLKEIYGMDNMRYKDIQGQLTVDKRKVLKLNVNTIEFEDLKNFPYLNYKQMNALIQYRKQHGDYESFSELSNIAILDEPLLKKMKPYFKIK